MLDQRKVEALKRRLEEAHDELSANWDRQGMSRRAADHALGRIEGLLDDLDQISKRAKTYHRQPDEPYMDSYGEGLYQREPDEDYMETFRGDEDSSEMMTEFGEARHQDRFAQNTDEDKYERRDPHEHAGPDAPDYHIDDDTGVNEEMQDRFGELCEDCRREARSRRRHNVGRRR